MNDDADAVIHRLKKRFGVESDGELAGRLLVSRSTVANWRSRDRVPERYRKVADGMGNWHVALTPYGEWSEIEKLAMIVAIARLIRDFADVGTDYRAFLEKGYEAAAYLMTYHGNSAADVANEMDVRASEDAFNCAQILIYNELFSPEAAAAAAAQGAKHTSAFGKEWYRKNRPVAAV